MSEKKTPKKPLQVIQETTITLTAEAAQKIKEALTHHACSGVRILTKPDERGMASFVLELEEKNRPDDLVLEDKGIKLFVDPSSTQHVQGIEIRYVTTEKGSGFSIVNPGG